MRRYGPMAQGVLEKRIGYHLGSQDIFLNVVGGLSVDDPAADLAICAGGSTMWEMACMGVPFIPIVIAENQRQAVMAMACDGYPTVDQAAVARDLPAAVAALAADAGRRQELSRRGQQLVDGRGAERVCAALHELAR